MNTPANLTQSRSQRPQTTTLEEQRAPADRPPVVIVGGAANALSIARSLSRYGVEVYAINKPTAPVRYSRYSKWIPIQSDENLGDAWTEFLLGPQSEHFGGALLLAGNDIALEIFAEHRAALEEKFLLDESNVKAQICMLNKLSTYRAAREAGVETPRFWTVGSHEDLLSLRDSLVYPLLVKPELSHVFTKKFRGKFFVANNFEEVCEAFQKVQQGHVDCMLVEKIPGLDDKGCSYYTYMDEQGRPLFDFTKRVIRRFPVNMGRACYHITDYNPEVREEALKLFRHVGLRGLAMVEFKRDARDGRLKLIEVNARFADPTVLLARSGFDLARLVYNRAIGLPQEQLKTYKTGMRLWHPIEDFMAFLQLRRQGQLTFFQWVASLMHRQMLPRFRWSDPLPSLCSEWNRLKRNLARRWTRATEAEAREADEY